MGIVASVLHYMKAQNASGTLVVSFWPSAHYWPLILYKYGNYLIAHTMHAGKKVLTHGRSHQFADYIKSLREDFTEI